MIPFPCIIVLSTRHPLKPYVYCGADYFGIELEGTALVRVIISGTNQ